MHVLVVHDYGPLGKILLERLGATHLKVSPLLVSDLASVDLDALENWIPEDTDLIVNALWLADPEVAEKDPEATHKAAFSLPVVLAEFARDKGMALFQLSSCYVFDGRKQSGYITSNPGQPVNELGNWQWECEQALRTLLPRHIILRTGWSLARFIRKVQVSISGSDQLSLPDPLPWSAGCHQGSGPGDDRCGAAAGLWCGSLGNLSVFRCGRGESL